jgi:hypothetical protein
MLRLRWRHLLLLSLPLAAPLVAAQELSITLFTGYTGAGQGLQRSAAGTTQALRLEPGPAASMSLDWALDAGRQIQLLAAYQRTALRVKDSGSSASPQRIGLEVLQVHLGGTNFVDARLGEGAYVAGGLGLTRFAPGVAGFESEVRVSMHLGAGYAVPLTRWMGLRAELRGHATLINSRGSFLCSPECSWSIQGDALTQLQAHVGLAFSF